MLNKTVDIYIYTYIFFYNESRFRRWLESNRLLLTMIYTIILY